MLADNVQTYLSEALDQEACKKTLTDALLSRVSALQELDIADDVIIKYLENLCDDPYELNDDVIEDVIEQIIIQSMT